MPPAMFPRCWWDRPCRFCWPGSFSRPYVPSGPRSACGAVGGGQPVALVLLGLTIAGTWLFEAFILGIVAHLHALLVAVVSLVITLVLAVYLNRQRVVVRG